MFEQSFNLPQGIFTAPCFYRTFVTLRALTKLTPNQRALWEAVTAFNSLHCFFSPQDHQINVNSSKLYIVNEKNTIDVDIMFVVVSLQTLQLNLNLTQTLRELLSTSSVGSSSLSLGPVLCCFLLILQNCWTDFSKLLIMAEDSFQGSH